MRRTSNEHVHRALNSIASIAACADTLIESDGRIDAPTRRALLEVISAQAADLRALIAGEDAVDSVPHLHVVAMLPREDA